MATQIVWTYRVLKFKSYSGSFVAYSVIVGVIPILSFAGLTLHVLTSTPHLRRFLIGFNSSTSRVPSRKGWVPSVILVNSLLLVWCIFVGAILAIPGRRAYQQGELARTTYASAMALIDKAKITGDLAGLAGLNDLMPTFGKLSLHSALSCGVAERLSFSWLTLCRCQIRWRP